MMKSTGKSSNLCRNRVSNEESLLRSSGESVSNDVAVPSSFKSLYGQIHHLVENESNFVALLKQINDRVTAPIWRRCLPWGSSNQSDPSLNVRPSSHRQVVNSLFYTTPALLRIHDNFLKDLKSLDMKVLSIRQVVWIFYINFNNRS
ncbi:hypothetical protein BDF22DRAFT_653949 [Syncephalis plumigaleata]|nr:hypothetical protein BDF22DRAFT_653949 [Syncephalis plumigaleata]